MEPAKKLHARPNQVTILLTAAECPQCTCNLDRIATNELRRCGRNGNSYRGEVLSSNDGSNEDMIVGLPAVEKEPDIWVLSMVIKLRSYTSLRGVPDR